MGEDIAPHRGRARLTATPRYALPDFGSPILKMRFKSYPTDRYPRLDFSFSWQPAKMRKRDIAVK